jgi:hypothetical protein
VQVPGPANRGAMLALAAEANAKINLETWKKALRIHKHLSTPTRGPGGKLLDLLEGRLFTSWKLAPLLVESFWTSWRAGCSQAGSLRHYWWKASGPPGEQAVRKLEACATTGGKLLDLLESRLQAVYGLTSTCYVIKNRAWPAPGAEPRIPHKWTNSRGHSR